MAGPDSRKELIKYALNKLGAPVTQVNVAPEQIEHCLDDAIQYMQDWHFDGTIKFYHTHELTAQDLTNRYVEIPDWVVSVTRLFPLSTLSKKNIWDLRYQLRLQDYYLIHQFDLANYHIVMQHFEYVNWSLSGEQMYDYNRREGKLYVHTNWDNLVEGDFICMEVFRLMDPATSPRVWNDPFLKKYFTLLLKQQMGTNLKKFNGMKLPDGTTLDGKTIYDEATADIKEFEDEMYKRQPPVNFFTG